MSRVERESGESDCSTHIFVQYICLCHPMCDIIVGGARVVVILSYCLLVLISFMLDIFDVLESEQQLCVELCGLSYVCSIVHRSRSSFLNSSNIISLLLFFSFFLSVSVIIYLLVTQIRYLQSI